MTFSVDICFTPEDVVSEHKFLEVLPRRFEAVFDVSHSVKVRQLQKALLHLSGTLRDLANYSEAEGG